MKLTMKTRIVPLLLFLNVWIIQLSCVPDLEIDPHALDNFSDNFNPILGFQNPLDSSHKEKFEIQLSINDTIPDSLYAISALKYDSILIIENCSFYYRKSMDDDSLSFTVQVHKERDTIDFRLLEDSTFIYTTLLPLDTGTYYIICSSVSINCDINNIDETYCYNDWKDISSCIEYCLGGC